MAKRQKLSFVVLDDMPDEIILKIFTFLDIREIFKCGQVSQRIRAISNDESLWLKLNFYEGHVPYELLEKAEENGCKYLSLAFATLYDGENSKLPLNLKYLEMSQDDIEPGFPGFNEVHKGLLKNCHSLQKLAMENSILKTKDIGQIGKNGPTLKVLNLANSGLSIPYPNQTKTIKKLFKRCVELVELNFSSTGPWDHKSALFAAIAYNLTPKILKVDLSMNKNLKDRHVEALIKRCNNITELDLSYTSITKASVDCIATHLKSSLEKLDVSYTEIDSTELLQLRSVGTLKVLHCFYKIKSPRVQEEYLRKNLPQVSINNEEHLFHIASSITDTVQYEDGFWEIKAEAQQIF